MEKKREVLIKITGCLLLFILFADLKAQPTADQLAEQIIEKNNQRLQNIETVEITSEFDEGGLAIESADRFIKHTQNGHTWMKPEDNDGDMGSGALSVTFDDSAAQVMRAAGEISNDMFDSHPVYRITIEDSELLNEYVRDEHEVEGQQMDMEKVIYWVDRNELIIRKILTEGVDENGNKLNIEIVLTDYQTHEGLPVAHTINMEIEGIDSQFSEEEITEARKSIREMKKQLEQMPEQQRKMVEDQMKNQIERFEKMLESGEMGTMVSKVTEVKINE